LFGAQDVSYKDGEESTGETSVEMLKSAKVKYAIIGHSERRALGETGEIISQKVLQVLSAGITPIICVGEEERDLDGDYLSFIEKEIHEALQDVPKNKLSKIVIAYEPVWSIGKGHEALRGYELHQMTIFIKKILAKIYDKKAAMSTPIIYGGSVDEENASDIIQEGEVSGLLIGRASLNPHVFANIVKSLD
jgi:triosephosphate isomerase